MVQLRNKQRIKIQFLHDPLSLCHSSWLVIVVSQNLITISIVESAFIVFFGTRVLIRSEHEYKAGVHLKKINDRA